MHNVIILLLLMSMSRPSFESVTSIDVRTKRLLDLKEGWGPSQAYYGILPGASTMQILSKNRSISIIHGHLVLRTHVVYHIAANRLARF